MRILRLALAISLAVLAACTAAPDEPGTDGGSTSSCASTCAGCCDPEGTCQPGLESAACGIGGNACGVCAGTDTCGADGACRAGVTTIDGDTCAAAVPVTLLGGSARVRGGLKDAAPGIAEGFECFNAFGSADRYYAFETKQPGNVVAHLEPLHGNDYGLLIQGACDGGALACEAEHYSGHVAVQLVDQTAGRYVVGVAAYAWDTTDEDYDLVIDTGPAPANDHCEDATTLELTGGHAKVRGTTRLAGNEEEQPISPRGDVFYRLTTTEVTNLVVEVTALEEGITLSPGFAQKPCGAPLATSGSVSGGSSFFVSSLPAGEWGIVVASPVVGGDFDLEITAKPPPPGETCADAPALTFTDQGGARVAEWDGNLGLRRQDLDLSCDGYDSENDVDEAWTFTIPTAQNVSIEVPSGISAAVMKGGCAQANELLCWSPGTWGPPSKTLGGLAAGTYTLVLSGYRTWGSLPYHAKIRTTTPLAGDGCSNATALATSATTGGSVTVQGNLKGLIDDVRCGSSSYVTQSRDAAYAFELATPMNLDAAVEAGEGSYAYYGLDLRRLDACGADSLGCEQAEYSVSAHLQRTSLAPGKYALFVEEVSGPETGDADSKFSLTFALTPTAPGETCSNAIDLPLVAGHAHADVTMTGRLDDVTACSGGVDAIYRFTTDRELDVRLTPSEWHYDQRVGLLKGTCDQLSCAAYPDDRGVVEYPNLPAGTWHVAVEQNATSPQNVGLDLVTQEHQPGETCANPLPITLTAGHATITGDTTPFFAQGGPCGQYGGPDVFHKLVVPRAQRLRATLGAASSTSTFQGGVSLLSSCAATELCSGELHSQSALTQGVVAPGEYVLAVRGSRGAYKLDVTLEDPVAGDGCSNALPLFAGPALGTVTKTVDLGAFESDALGACEELRDGRDAVYTFTTTEPLNFRAFARYAEYGNPVLALHGGTCGAPTCLVSSSSGAIEKGVLPAGTWRLVVDEWYRASFERGEITLEVSLTKPGTGEDCAHPQPLAFVADGAAKVATVRANTKDLFDSLTSTCSADHKPTEGHDAVYSFTVDTPSNARIRLEAITPDFTPSVYALTTSCAPDAHVCDHTDENFHSALEDWAALAPGTYLLVVDSPANDVGEFELKVRLLPQATPGERCAAPIQLTVTNAAAHADGHIEDWFGDDVLACRFLGQGANEDVVYSFQTTSEQFVKAKITTTAEWDAWQPVLGLSPSSCDPKKVECVGGGGQTAQLAALVPAGTHYLFVDGALGGWHTGDYQLDLTLGARPAGDTCVTAIPLVLSNGAAGGTASVGGNTWDFLGDVVPTCNRQFDDPPHPSGRDVVYRFTTNRSLALDAKLHFADNDSSGTLTLASTCGAADATCAGTNEYPYEARVQKRIPAGTYYLFVDDTWSGDGHEFTLDVSLNP